jgi:hypothetical protein
MKLSNFLRTAVVAMATLCGYASVCAAQPANVPGGIAPPN